MPPKAHRKSGTEQLPPTTDWRTVDDHELLKRRPPRPRGQTPRRQPHALLDALATGATRNDLIPDSATDALRMSQNSKT